MTRTASLLMLCSLLTACAEDAPAADEHPMADASEATTVQSSGRLGVAMSGAPMAIASGARIMEFDAAGNLTELRPGTNGWTCIVDDAPAAPGDSPDCLDARWQAWFASYMKGEPPKTTGIGLAYMLQGSLSPSNTDPFLETPPPGETWMEDGPHVMLIVPDAKLLEGFPHEHGMGGPYVMYAGTPYAHLMIPIAGH
jgi:hypothetical protein